MRAALACLVISFGIFIGGGRALAQPAPEGAGSAEPTEAAGSGSGSAEETGSGAAGGSGSAEEHAGSGSGSGVAEAHAGSAEPATAPHADPPHEPAAAVSDDDDNGGVPYNKWDEDGDGKVEPEEEAEHKEYDAEFAGIDATIDEKDIAELNARPAGKTLLPSLTIEHFRKIVQITKKVVLGRMAKKIAKKNAQKMAKFGMLVIAFSGAGLLLLLMPLFLAKKYPGQGKVLFKYSGLAALTFVVTVNLFGGVLFLMRGVQTALSDFTNPQIALAEGFFNELDQHAEDYVVMGKELFAPTLEQLSGNSDEQPAVALLGNGMQIVKDAKVFLDIAKMVKKIDFILGALPIILMVVTLVLFILAIKPTLIEIIKLPAAAASGASGVGKDVVANSARRVVGELKATLCTLGVLALLTIVSSVVLGQIVQPSLRALLEYFSLALQYLQFVHGASSGLVFLTLFAVIFFLVLNLAALILSMSFFLGKSQKIFQARFNHGVPLATHARFFKWGAPSVLLVHLFPLVFVEIAAFGLAKINDSLTGGATDAEAVSWSKLMLAGPIFLVAGFLVLFWAARCLKAIGFLFKYKIPKPQ
jgi:hypothetical protein